jgi:hypothetical protein
MKKQLVIINDQEDNTDSNGPVYNEDEFIFCKKPNGEITSCGFSVNSALLREGKSPMMGLTPFLRGTGSARNGHEDDDDDEDDDESTETRHSSGHNIHHHVSEMFKNMSVPAGIFYIQQKNQPCKQDNIYEEDDISEDLFDKLLNLASENEKRKRKAGTRKAEIILVAGGKQARKTKKLKKSASKE